MAPEFDRARPGDHHPLALRDGEDRRQGERRAYPRAGPDRRRGQRRRQWLGHALLTSLTLGVPMPTNSAKLRPRPPLARSAPQDIEIRAARDIEISAVPPDDI